MVEWQDVKLVGRPPCGDTKSWSKGWLTWDGICIRWETTHPAYWNEKAGEKLFMGGKDGPVVTHWAEVEPPAHVKHGER